MIPSNTDTSTNSDSSKVCPYFTSSPTTTSPMIAPIEVTGAISPPISPPSSVSLPSISRKTSSAAQHQLQLHSSSTLTTTGSASPTIASHIYPDENTPTQAQIDVVRYTWERISELRLPNDDPNVSATHAFGLAFYDALFESDPSLRPLLPNVLKQARALAGMVSFIAQLPKITGPYNPIKTSPGSSPSSLPETCAMISSACPATTTKEDGRKSSQEKVLTIREINALKRKTSTATTFPELIASVAASAAGTTKNVEPEEIEGDSERLLCKLRELGARHYFYHVQPHQLDLIGPAVLKAIEKRLQKEFLPEVAEAWTRVKYLKWLKRTNC